MKNLLNTMSGSRPGPACFALGLAALALTSCESITGVASADTPRVEIELAVIVNDQFVESLEDLDKDSPLYAALKTAVAQEADLGLRFYPTPSERYGKQDKRPDYLMTVELNQLNFAIEQELVESEGQAAHIESSVDKVSCEVTATIERRRDNAPSLVVATAKGASEVSAESDAQALSTGTGYAPKHDGAELKILERDIARAVENASRKALKSMRTPVDREFAAEAEVEASPQAPAGASQG
jgi:hypothetical protein